MPVFNGAEGSIAVSDADMALHRRAQAGYADVRAGRGWAAEYDRWPTAEQLAYETGRAWARNIRTAKIHLPAWPRNKPPSLDVSIAASRAAQRIGNALPGDIRPPDDSVVRLEPGSIPRGAADRRLRIGAARRARRTAR